jgi:hypothetical protein
MFQEGFDEGLSQVQLSFMQSDGGLSPVASFSGHKAVLSGPAGGCGPLSLSPQTLVTWSPPGSHGSPLLATWLCCQAVLGGGSPLSLCPRNCGPVAHDSSS